MSPINKRYTRVAYDVYNGLSFRENPYNHSPMSYSVTRRRRTDRVACFLLATANPNQADTDASDLSGTSH